MHPATHVKNVSPLDPMRVWVQTPRGNPARLNQAFIAGEESASADTVCVQPPRVRVRIPRGIGTPVKHIRTDIWREGNYFDLWSVPHFLSGLLVGLFLYVVGFGFASSAVISLLLLIVYEMFEIVIDVRETWMNRVLDVVVGMVSFYLAFYFAFGISKEVAFLLFGGIALTDLLISSFGWIASHKAASLETKLKAEYFESKQRLRARRVLLKRQVREQRDKWRMRRKWWNHKRSNLGLDGEAPQGGV